MKLSVVIITKNEAHIIETTLKSLSRVTNDIIIVDSGSTDGTVALCKTYGAQVIETGWAGYGNNKNLGIEAAKHDWILSLDADEAIDEQLQQSLLALEPGTDKDVFELAFKNFYCNKWIRFGEWGFDAHIRLFNKQKVRWNTAAVHENLVLPVGAIVKKLPGHILHYTVQNRQEYDTKTDNYARMNAKKYVESGKKTNLFKQYFSPVFAFLQHYIFRLGFLDGKEGLIIAKTTAYYTFLKYRYLKQMNSNTYDETKNKL